MVHFADVSMCRSVVVDRTGPSFAQLSAHALAASSHMAPPSTLSFLDLCVSSLNEFVCYVCVIRHFSFPFPPSSLPCCSTPDPHCAFCQYHFLTTSELISSLDYLLFSARSTTFNSLSSIRFEDIGYSQPGKSD